MLQSRAREKLLNSIIFFVENTKFCGKTKLFKLLYFLDFQHYMDVGRNVSGLDYYAWPKGPVPKDLFEEFDRPDEDMTAALDVRDGRTFDGKDMLRLTPIVPFDRKLFTKRELRIMESLASEYRDAYADDIIEATHLENLPWHRVYEDEGRKQELIPYEYAVRKAESDEVGKSAEEHEEFVRNYE